MPRPATAAAVAIDTAQPGDEGGLRALFEAAYTDSSHPCKGPDFLRMAVASPDFIWRVARDGQRIVACTACVRHAWNRTWEVGRGVTDPAYRGEGLAGELCRQCIGAACLDEACDLVHGFPRNATIARISARTQPALLFTGHDGGINVANGVREYHGAIFGRNPRAQFRHALPKTPCLAHSDFVRRNVFDALGLDPAPGAYPLEWIAGPGGRSVAGHPFSIAYDAACVSASLEITGYSGGARTGREFAAEVTALLAAFPRARHVRAAVLVDKTGVIAELARAGFEATAYLPAWHGRDGARFDCVLMVRASFDREPVAHGIGDVVTAFRAGLASC